MRILDNQHGLDTRHRGWNRRNYALIDENDKTILQVTANLYFPDCFKWQKLYKLGWKVHIIGKHHRKEIDNTNEIR